MRFMLRDDDVCRFTEPARLEAAYGSLDPKTPVSLAIIPFVVETRNWGDPKAFWQNDTAHPLGQNLALLDYLRAGIDEGRFAIVLHGHRHRYLPGPAPHTWIPELVHLKNPEPALREGRGYLEDLFGVPVPVLTPPSNAMSPRAYRAVVRLGMHLTQLHPIRTSLAGRATAELPALGRRLVARARHGREHPDVLRVGARREVSNLPITPRAERARVFQELAYRHARDGSICVSTHHWELGERLTDGSGTVGSLLAEVLDWLASHDAEARDANALLTAA